MDSDDFDDARRALRDVHRASAALLDERPSARVRTAVLAAAATTARTRRGGRFGAHHWPRSLAAGLIVAVMTGLVATQVVRREPERIADATVAAVPQPPAVPPAGPARDVSAKPAAADVAPVAAPAPRRAAPQPHREATRAKAVPQQPADERDASDRRANAAPPASVAAAAPGPSPPVADASTPAPGERRRAAVSEVSRAAGSAQAFSAPAPTTPDAWVARIVELRAAHRDDDADRELDALRARYPGFIVPPAALRAGERR